MTRKPSRVRLTIEELESRNAPAALKPALVGPDLAPGHVKQQAANTAHDRPFQLKEAGTAVMNADGTIDGTASGQATHLGAFTLHDHSTVVGVDATPDGIVLHIVGVAHLEAANGDHLCANFSGTVNLTTGEGNLIFQWSGGDGRFANATGTTTWHIHVNPDLTYTGDASGVINY